MRPKKCVVQKSIDKAGVLYWKWQILLEKTDEDVMATRQGNKRMGRPPVPLPELRLRAQKAYQTEIEILRSLESAKGMPLTTIEQIIARGEDLRDNGPGRPAITDIGLKHRHLRRKLKHLENAQNLIDSGNGDSVTLGRTAMSVADRVNHYKREIEAVKAEIEAEITKLSEVERLKLLLDNALIDQRDLKIKFKSASRKEKPGITNLLEAAKAEIALLTQLYQAEQEFQDLQKAG